MRFSREEYWSGLPFPTPGDLPNPKTEATSYASPALAVDSLPLSPEVVHKKCWTQVSIPPKMCLLNRNMIYHTIVFVLMYLYFK